MQEKKGEAKSRKGREKENRKITLQVTEDEQNQIIEMLTAIKKNNIKASH